MVTTVETPAIAAARHALLAAVTQQDRFDLTIALEVLLDAKLASALAFGLIETKGQHPMIIEREGARVLRSEQDARLAAERADVIFAVG